MAAQLLKLVKPLAGMVKEAYGKIANAKEYVEAVNNLASNDDIKQAAIKIIENSNELNDVEKLEQLKELQTFVAEQKAQAADEINEHQILISKIFIAVLSAGFSVPIEAVINALSKKDVTLLEKAEDLD